jgi:hypothetical protein
MCRDMPSIRSTTGHDIAIAPRRTSRREQIGSRALNDTQLLRLDDKTKDEGNFIPLNQDAWKSEKRHADMQFAGY